MSFRSDRSATLLALLLFAAVSATPTTAAAYEERLELSLGLGPSIAFADGVAPGAGFDLLVSRGLSESWSLGGSLRYSMNHGDTFEHRLSGAIDATWVLDIVLWVPRISFGLGPILATSADRTSVGIESHLRAGADRLTDFGFVGLELRLDSYGFLTDSVPGRVALGVGVRVGWLIERF